MFFIFLSLWLGYWSAEAGASLPWSKLWQDKKKWFSEIPEFIIAFTISIISIYVFNNIFNFNFIDGMMLFLLMVSVSYSGKQSATWAYLTWSGYLKDDNKDGVIDNRDGRKSTLKFINDWISSKINKKLGDKEYSWVWAFTKGFITTFPVFGFGCLFQPLCREVASHAKSRLAGDSNMYMEIADGVSYAMSCCVFLFIGGLIVEQ